MGNPASREEFEAHDIDTQNQHQYYSQHHQQPDDPRRDRQASPSTSGSNSFPQRQHVGRDCGKDREWNGQELDQSCRHPHQSYNHSLGTRSPQPFPHTHQLHDHHSQPYPPYQQDHDRFYSPDRWSHPVDNPSVSSHEGGGLKSRYDGRRIRQPRRIGPYLIDRTLGSGGSGTVKLGIVPETGVAVALKLIYHSEILSDRFIRKQVEQEMELLPELKHPHIIRLDRWMPYAYYQRSSGEQVPVAVLVMELARERSLEDYMAYTGPAFEEIIARTLFRQLLSALAYCHSRDVYHRDIKPGNLLLDDEFNIKVADFGLAKLFSHDGRHVVHTNCGTDGYRAPEVVDRSVQYLDKADLWSAGVVLFRMVVGFLPFLAFDNRPNDLWKVVCAGNWEFFWQSWDPQQNFTGEFRDLVSRLLSPVPLARPSAAQASHHPWLTKLNSAPQVVVEHEFVRRRANMGRNQPISRDESYSSEDCRALPSTPAFVFLIPPEMESIFPSPALRSGRGYSYGIGDNKLLGKKFAQTHHDREENSEKCHRNYHSEDHSSRPPDLCPGYPLGLSSIITTQIPEVVVEAIENVLDSISNNNYSHLTPWKFQATFITNLGTAELSMRVVSVGLATFAILFIRRSGPVAAFQSAFAELFCRLSHLTSLQA